MDFVAAQRGYKAGEASGGYYRSSFSQFLLHPVNDSVHLGRVAVEDPATHTINGILADNPPRNIQADIGKLGGLAA